MAFLLSVTLVTPRVSAQWMRPSSRLPDDSILQNFSAERPPSGLGRGYPHRDVLAAHAERLRREAPDALDTFEILLALERADERGRARLPDDGAAATAALDELLRWKKP